MSTLNTLGFNVRRKRYQHTPTPLNSKQDKTVSSTNESASSTLAFQAPTSIHQPIKTSIAPSLQLKSSSKNLKSKPSKRQSSRKDPKQATLLPFFSTKQQQQQQQEVNTPATPSPQSSLIPQPSTSTPLLSQQEDENEVCQVRRHLSVVDLFPMFVETYCNDYNHEDSNIDQHRPDSMVLLQVKQSKSIYSTLYNPIVNNSQERPLRRRRSEKDEQVTKRSCTALERPMDSFLDEFDSQQEDDDSIKMVRHCLTTDQVNSLLLDIANEYFAFNDNTWCASYLD